MKHQSQETSSTNKIKLNHNSNGTNVRRNALKKIAVGSTVVSGGLVATQWVKPVINSIITPAHAQASALSCEGITPPTGSQTFDSPGNFEFTVPECITEVMVQVSGAAGGRSLRNSQAPGVGGLSTGTINVSGGDVLSLIVGGQGFSSDDTTPVTGGIGFGNGGAALIRGGGGGGGSAIIQNGSPIVVGGGGGGEGRRPTGGGGDGNGGASVNGLGSGPEALNQGGSRGIGAGNGGDIGTGNNGGGNGGEGTGGGGRGGAGGGGGYGGGAGSVLGSFGGGGGGGLAGPGGSADEGGGSSGDGFVVISW